MPFLSKPNFEHSRLSSPTILDQMKRKIRFHAEKSEVLEPTRQRSGFCQLRFIQ